MVPNKGFGGNRGRTVLLEDKREESSAFMFRIFSDCLW